MVVTIDAMHDAPWTERAVKGWESQLDKAVAPAGRAQDLIPTTNRNDEKRHDEESAMSKPTPFLWFDNNAEEAMNFYVSIFPNSKVVSTTRYGAGGPGPAGTVMTARSSSSTVRSSSRSTAAPCSSSPRRSPSSSHCETQAEVDRFWDKLTAGGGEPGPCGWLKDKYGLSWQVVPAILPKLLPTRTPPRPGRAMAAHA